MAHQVIEGIEPMTATRSANHHTVGTAEIG
jgi:hypothetical protein